MKRHAITISSALLLVISASQPAFADKPEWAGAKEKPSREQVESHREEMKAKRGSTEAEMEEVRTRESKEYSRGDKYSKEGKGVKDKIQQRDREHQDDENHDAEMKQDRDRERVKESTMEKQREKKAESVQTQTEQSESQNRRWWKFWGE